MSAPSARKLGSLVSYVCSWVCCVLCFAAGSHSLCYAIENPSSQVLVSLRNTAQNQATLETWLSDDQCACGMFLM